MGLAFPDQDWVTHICGPLVRHIMMEHTVEQIAHFMSQEEKRNGKEQGSHNLLLEYTQWTKVFYFYFFGWTGVWTQGLTLARTQCTEDFLQGPFSKEL
jgi:hypothetical protein